MKKSIDHILEGDFLKGTGILSFSCTQIEHELHPGEELEDVFHILGPPGLYTEGHVYTDDLSLEIYTPSFTGAESEIAYSYNAAGHIAGDKVKGEIHIISNHGEYTIPYHISICAVELDSGIGQIKNLFHFTNLAKTHWGEAINLFGTPGFSAICRGSDRQYEGICRGLADGRGVGPTALSQADHNLEEFLLAIRKKQKIAYLISGSGMDDTAREPEIKLPAPSEPTELSLVITRNGWGHTCLHCQAEGDFLRLGKETVRDEDFLANVYKLPYYIEGEQLHPCKNLGLLRLSDAHGDIRIPVTITQAKASGRGRQRGREQKQCILDLTNQYIALRTKQISQTVWRRETEALIDRLIAADDTALLPKLFRIQLLITENRLGEAGKMLNHADTLLQGREREWPEL